MDAALEDIKRVEKLIETELEKLYYSHKIEAQYISLDSFTSYGSLFCYKVSIDFKVK